MNTKPAEALLPQEVLDALSDSSRACIENLTNYLSSLERPDFSSNPHNKLAGVLVLLYEENGQLRVLLTTRSKHLRTHAGQTALPGGKKDPSDADLMATAFREANEEVSLPLNHPFIHTLGLMQPFISLHKILVTPVVAFLSQPKLLSSLKAAEGEVSHIFTHPLKAILDPTLAKEGPLVSIGSEDWPYDSDVYNTSDSVVQMLGNTTYRMHRFRTSASPIKGLTADILIKLAEITYARPTKYERYAPDQLRNITADCKYNGSLVKIETCLKILPNALPGSSQWILASGSVAIPLLAHIPSFSGLIESHTVVTTDSPVGLPQEIGW